MKEYNKQFDYRGYQFNITIYLDYKVEKRINGKTWSKIRINCLGSDNYYKTEEFLPELIGDKIYEHMDLARQYVDNKLTGPPLSETENKLIKLGFK
jgi:hypothetical protein